MQNNFRMCSIAFVDKRGIWHSFKDHFYPNYAACPYRTALCPSSMEATRTIVLKYKSGNSTKIGKVIYFRRTFLFI